MKVGIIGSGGVAQALGSGLIAEGYQVMLGSRDPNKPAIGAWLEKSKAAGRAGSFAEAAQFGEIVVVATRGTATEQALRLAGVEHFSGKLVIDVTNPLQMSPEKRMVLAPLPDGSLGETVQRVLAGAKVVKAFNTVNSAHMYRPAFPGGTPEMFFCGDDGDAKKTVAELLAVFGWVPVDAGGIEAARMLEPLSLLGIRLALASGNWNYVFRLIRKEG